MITRSRTRNNISIRDVYDMAIYQDGVLAYLKKIHEEGFTLDSEYQLTVKPVLPVTSIAEKRKQSTLAYLNQSSYLFKQSIFEQIHALTPPHQIGDALHEEYKTIELLGKKKDIILNAKLVWHSLVAEPAIIASEAWILQHFPQTILPTSKPYHLILLKDCTIRFIQQDKHISNDQFHNGYRFHLYLQHTVFSHVLQEVGLSAASVAEDLFVGLIWAKQFKTKHPKTDFLAHVLCENQMEWSEMMETAHERVRDIYTHWKTLTPLIRNSDTGFWAPTGPLFHPNMKHKIHDEWSPLRTRWAQDIGEITLMWNCGLTERDHAWDQEIYRLDDPRLNSRLLLQSAYSCNTLDTLLQQSRPGAPVFPPDFRLNLARRPFEFMVDFETCLLKPDMATIYLIGVKNVQTGEYVAFVYSPLHLFHTRLRVPRLQTYPYNKRVVECLTEESVIRSFVQYIDSFRSPGVSCEDYAEQHHLMHWSTAEPSWFNKKVEVLRIGWECNWLQWYDLLRVFRPTKTTAKRKAHNEGHEDPIPLVIRGMHNFGLKEVVRHLHQAGQIDLHWPDIDDGLLSMFIARDIYTSTSSSREMMRLVDYNEVDCMALYEIVCWLRNFGRVQPHIPLAESDSSTTSGGSGHSE